MPENDIGNSARSPELSIIVVNWNTRDLLRNCLRSVYETVTDLCYEIIVVDNASTDGSLEMLEKEFPGVNRIVNRQNRGFGRANNQAFAIMKGRYALLLNTDTMVTSVAVGKLWQFMETHQDVGIVGGQLLNADGSKQNSVASFPNLMSLLLNMPLLEYVCPRKYPSKRYSHAAPIEVDSVIGACMMIRKEALEQAGFFDERYFFFFEETDLARSIRLKGWKVYHVPDAFIYHLQGQSIGDSAKSRMEFYRSRYQFLKKWHGRSYFSLAKIIIFSRLLVNYVSSLLLAVLTLGMNRKAKNKATVCLELIRWHFKKK
ncbi:MAG TPA: glycosyltransferase family 2 protein [Smithella sp.]|nr:glycosyltransferase family 2 protein [Smithella sp.]HRS97111.1 glycosyltransferase family 2 protein [Smithella sp.]